MLVGPPNSLAPFDPPMKRVRQFGDCRVQQNRWVLPEWDRKPRPRLLTPRANNRQLKTRLRTQTCLLNGLLRKGVSEVPNPITD